MGTFVLDVKLPFSQANGRIATKLGCSGVGQSQAAWKLINIHILKLSVSADWSAAEDER